MSDKPKPSPEAVIKSLEACAEPFAGCDGCAFGPCDCPDCMDNLMLAAAEYLREKYVPGEWIEDEDFYADTVYRCPKCGEEFYLESGNPGEGLYNHCPNCGKRLEMPKEV